MWDGLFLLLALSLSMGIASFLAGLLPLSIGLSQNHARVISSIGTGLLVGTCLIIIIPEGVETLYSAQAPVHSSIGTRQSDDGSPLAEKPPADTGTPSARKEPHAYIGLSIVIGFIMMYLIDQIPKHLSNLPSSAAKSRYVSLANLGIGPRSRDQRQRMEDAESVAGDELHDGASDGTQQSSATTIGLVIHAAADGIALAASSFLTQSSTGFIVFLAIMIHKAPAAFGLTSVLLKQGYTKRQARTHLIVFSLAAPAGALGTWFLVNILAGGRIEGEESTQFATGLLLLFSGGTFLYVAMHTMQEEGSSHGHQESGNGYVDGNAYSAASLQRRNEAGSANDFRDTMLKVVGMLLPLLAQVGHH